MPPVTGTCSGGVALGMPEDDDLWDSPETGLGKAKFLREHYSDRPLLPLLRHL